MSAAGKPSPIEQTSEDFLLTCLSSHLIFSSLTQKYVLSPQLIYQINGTTDKIDWDKNRKDSMPKI